ncbi:hypothetical protein [Phenylobacterium sp.]|uniref:hypothetical protein n=1 Tax=Phenylobacterium sp. TaxID=1871053 RepID=UPI0035B471C4
MGWRQARFDFENRGEGVEAAASHELAVADVTRRPAQAERGGLEHPHHREWRWAHLAVLRRGDCRLLVPQAWEFRSVIRSGASEGDGWQAARGFDCLQRSARVSGARVLESEFSGFENARATRGGEGAIRSFWSR